MIVKHSVIMSNPSIIRNYRVFTIITFLAAISKRWDKHNLRLSYQLADDLYIDRSNLVEADTKSSIDIIYQFTFNQGSIAASVRNITNNQYQDFSNRPARGRWITLYANYSF